MSASKNDKFQQVWLLGLGIHLLVFAFVLDIYFTSPIKHGMTPHHISGVPLAKRIVIFLADGLRAEAILPEKHWGRVKYLTDLRLNQNSKWGVVHTGVPTESRPGHVAIFAGLYEDPSALFTGWQANTVEFDSIINESNYAWSYGSPDVVKIFQKHDKSRLHIEYYDPNEEDFSGRSSTTNLDIWVFNRVHALLNSTGNSCETQLMRNFNENHEFINCTRLYASGNVFFLHLLGMDTAGHVHKPDSKEYLDNLKVIDEGIRKSVQLFEEYFNDKETVFLFTSDHGMTNWGSHGDGSVHETEVPYILWGKGVNADRKRFDLNQVDLAPLIANLIGIAIPINSVGVLCQQLLNGSHEQILEAVYANVLQLLEQYYCLVEEFEEDPLFEEFSLFKDGVYVQNVLREFEIVLNASKTQIDSMRQEQVENATKLGHEIMTHILQANNYMRYYYFKPKIACVILGFLMWMNYLQLSVHLRSNIDDGRIQMNAMDERKCTNVFRGVLGFFTLLACTIMTVVNAYLFTYLYPLFPLGILYLYSKDNTIIKQLLLIIRTKYRTEFIWRSVKYGILVQLLVFGFFQRLCCALIMVILALGVIKINQSVNIKARWFIMCGMMALLQLFKPSTEFKYYGLDSWWFIMCTIMALLQLFKPSTEFKYYGLIIGSIVWIGIYLKFILPMGNEYVQYFDIKYKSRVRKIILAPLCIFILAAGNISYTVYDSNFWYLDLNLSISWILSVSAIILIPFAPRGILIRFAHIAACLIVPYTLMAVNIDLVFYAVLTATLYLWMFVETSEFNSKISISHSHFAYEYTPKQQQILSTQYRITFFYLALTICYFFAIGNMASFNGFDPQWTRAFVATFNPILMATLIIIKMIIPFFLITCAFYAIVLVTRQNYTNVFMILLLFLDQMVLNFMLFVRNEGSWKEIGKSLSHFAVMEAMALVMLVFFGIAKYVCSFYIGDERTCILSQFDENPHDSDENSDQINVTIEHSHDVQLSDMEKRLKCKVKHVVGYFNRFFGNTPIVIEVPPKMPSKQLRNVIQFKFERNGALRMKKVTTITQSKVSKRNKLKFKSVGISKLSKLSNLSKNTALNVYITYFNDDSSSGDGYSLGYSKLRQIENCNLDQSSSQTKQISSMKSDIKMMKMSKKLDVITEESTSMIPQSLLLNSERMCGFGDAPLQTVPDRIRQQNSDANYDHKLNTCSEHLTQRNMSMSTHLLTKTDIVKAKMHRTPNSPRETLTKRDSKKSYPTFVDCGPSDASVYLLKVEKWLNKSDTTKIMPTRVQNKINSKSSKNPLDFRDDMSEEACSGIQEKPHNKLILKIARQMFADRILPNARNINQVCALVKYMLTLAQDYGSEEVSWARFSIGTQTAKRSVDRGTSTTSISKKNQASGTMKIYRTHIGIQHSGNYQTFYGTITQGTQTSVDTITRATSPKKLSPRLTASVGIQNCFNSIGVGPDCQFETISSGVQSAIETRDAFSSSYLDVSRTSLERVTTKHVLENEIERKESLSSLLNDNELASIKDTTVEFSEISPERYSNLIKWTTDTNRLLRGEETEAKHFFFDSEIPATMVHPLVIKTQSLDSTMMGMPDDVLDFTQTIILPEEPDNYQCFKKPQMFADKSFRSIGHKHDFLRRRKRNEKKDCQSKVHGFHKGAEKSYLLQRSPPHSLKKNTE